MRCIEFGRPEGKFVPAPAPRGGSQQTVGSRLLSTLRPQPPTAGPWGGARRLKPALLSFGVGANFELDNMELAVQTRLKFQDWLTLKVRSSPAYKPYSPDRCWSAAESAYSGASEAEQASPLSSRLTPYSYSGAFLLQSPPITDADVGGMLCTAVPGAGHQAAEERAAWQHARLPAAAVRGAARCHR